MSFESEMPGESEEILEGTLETIAYTHPGTRFTVGRLMPDGSGRELVTVVGRMPEPQPGQHLRLWGRWMLHPNYGRQFKFDRYHVTPPSSLDGLRRYLSSGAVPGVRDRLAERIIETFGDRTLEVLDREPQLLASVKGLGKRRAQAIRALWDSSREQRELQLFLASHGIGGALAGRILDRYGAETVQVVSREPFRMAREVPGIGFKTADAIAQRMGMPPDAPGRAAAALSHLLDEASRQGHLFLPASQLLELASVKLSVPPESARMALRHLLDENALVSDGPAETPDIYLPLYFEAERDTADRLRKMGLQPSELVAGEIELAAHAFEAEQQIQLHPLQLEGLRKLADSRVLIITGGPGTGKTTLLRGLIRLLDARGIVTALAAPTGRAAKRMEEASDKPASTLHRLLKFDPKSQAFLHHEGMPLEARCVIVDEASMLDMLLAHALVRAMRPETYLILMGDVDQLPSVGPGSVLRELIAGGSIPTVRLRHVFRQAAESSIQVNAHRINQGLMPEFSRDRSRCGQEFVLLERDDPAEAARAIVDLYCYQIPKVYGLDPQRDVQILTPMHKGEAGTANLNRMVQQQLARPLLGRASTGDRVMQIVNNYNKEVFNGDAGVVSAYDERKDLLEVDFDGRLLTYTGAERDQLVLAYAITVHKSQGSEYPAVVMALTSQHALMLQRNLLYTAVTRARKVAILVGSRHALNLAVRNNRIQRRNSRLAELMRRGHLPDPEP